MYMNLKSQQCVLWPILCCRSENSKQNILFFVSSNVKLIKKAHTCTAKNYHEQTLNLTMVISFEF